jgi:hypothetical protein
MTAQPIFAHAAPELCRYGFAVLPAHGKQPTRSGFAKWKHPPGLRAVLEWGKQDPTANIVYIPELCRTKRGGDGIIVVDGDDEKACGKILERFGYTPGKVRTRRGRHFLYRSTGGSLGSVQSLKRYGLNADVKHGRSIVVAPPSLHASGTVYTWEGCDPTVISDLPVLDAGALQRLIDKGSGRETAPDLSGGLRQGSRGLGLNDFLCKHAWAVDSRDELFDLARMFNQDYPTPLGDEEVVRRSNTVWNDRQAGTLERWVGREAKARVGKDELKHLCSFGSHGGDAVALLLLLRGDHTARVRRGETFAISCKAMAKAKSLDWSVRRFSAARDVLLAAGYIKVVSSGRNSRTGHTSTKYTFATPSSRSADRAKICTSAVQHELWREGSPTRGRGQ